MVDAFFRHINLPEVGLVDLVPEMLRQVLLEITMEGVRSPNQNLLQNRDDVGVVECLGRESVNHRRDVDLSSSEER